MSEKNNHENQFAVELCTKHDNGTVKVLFATHLDHGYTTPNTAHHVLATLDIETERLPVMDTQVLFAGPGKHEALEGFNASHIIRSSRTHPLVTLDVTALALNLTHTINEIITRVYIAKTEAAGGVMEAFKQGKFISPMELGIASMVTMSDPATAKLLEEWFLRQTAQDQLPIVGDTQFFGSYTL